MPKGVRKTRKAQDTPEDLMIDIIMALKEVKDCLAAQTILLSEVVAWIKMEPEHEC